MSEEEVALVPGELLVGNPQAATKPPQCKGSQLAIIGRRVFIWRASQGHLHAIREIETKPSAQLTELTSQAGWAQGFQKAPWRFVDSWF
jgi:hypothetical protein